MQPVAGKEILGQGFDCATGFADAKHNGFRGIKLAKQALKLFRANIVANPEPGAVIIRAILAWRKGALDGAGAKRRTANAQKQHVSVVFHAFNGLWHICFQARPVGHAQEGELPCGQFAGQPFAERIGLCLPCLAIILFQTAGKCAGPFKIIFHYETPVVRFLLAMIISWQTRRKDYRSLFLFAIRFCAMYHWRSNADKRTGRHAGIVKHGQHELVLVQFFCPGLANLRAVRRKHHTHIARFGSKGARIYQAIDEILAIMAF